MTLTLLVACVGSSRAIAQTADATYAPERLRTTVRREARTGSVIVRSEVPPSLLRKLNIFMSPTLREHTHRYEYGERRITETRCYVETHYNGVLVQSNDANCDQAERIAARTNQAIIGIGQSGQHVKLDPNHGPQPAAPSKARKRSPAKKTKASPQGDLAPPEVSVFGGRGSKDAAEASIGSVMTTSPERPASGSGI